MTAWYDNRDYLAGFARWLYHRCFLSSGADMLDFFDDPLSWIVDRQAGNLRVEYEAERGTAL